MARPKVFGALVVLALATAACNQGQDVVTPFTVDTETDGGQGPGSNTNPNPGDDDGVVDDTGFETDDATGDETGNPPGNPGDPCSSHEDCVGFCWDPDGDEKGECVEPCDRGQCPEGYICNDVQIGNQKLDLCVPVPEVLCDQCRTSADCGGPNDLCITLNGGNFCSIACGQDASICPPGFGCGLIGSVGDGQLLMQCVPDNGICCIDADGDIYGIGDGCYDVDCDDTNPVVHTSAAEVCDGFDNDCNGQVDDQVIDCAQPACMLGVLGYFEISGEECVSGSCVGGGNSMCGQYTCSEGEENGDECADACNGEDDMLCIPPAHCDANACTPDVPNGGACDEDSDCESDHCGNGFCCAFGDCCSVASDCPTFGTQNPICTSPISCQGTIGQTLCGSGSQCTNTGMVEDDSACTATTLADDCGPYPAVYCTGAVNQVAPTCADSCAADADCDANAHCNPGTMQCEPDGTNGSACQADSWCLSGHCQNGFCCDSGDCCFSETDCPASYSTPPVCTSPDACQGERNQAVCNANQCATAIGIADDSACVAGTVASTCGPYPSAFCLGGSVQNPPVCASSCTADVECDTNAYCSAASVCVPDQGNGSACTSDTQCISNHCDNGYCCDSGVCCSVNGNCDAMDEPAECIAPNTCQGERVDGTCNPSFQCVATTMSDDSACAGIIANDCGPYPSQTCSNAVNQNPPVCGSSCMGDGDCDVSANCTGGVCVPDSGQGGFCTVTTQCAAGLQCVDNVCCNSACTGSCQACDVAGSVGTCVNIPNGQDLDNECNGLSCDAYYHSWSGDNCRDRADVTAGNHHCNGAGACQTAASRCPSQPVGQTVLTCNAQCQDPTANTCTGTTPGTCTNVNPGNNTCGQGVCQNTMPMCQNGAPLACQPNNSAQTNETCNDLDDNCDGTIDNGNFSDPYEPNGACNGTTLATVGSNQTVTYTNMTLYGSGDNDYYRFNATENDSQCSCCDTFCFDEDYQVRVTLTVPANAGSYWLCTTSNACSGNITGVPAAPPNGNCIHVLAGQSGQRVHNLDGACPGGDSYTMYARVAPGNNPAYECAPYTLSYQMLTGCF